ncbi:M61 family metallopeptidase [Tundrisphaera lichenicola]|uniref:M61 family metallopeptidase n=1 Tax=Tundrisphaera lichenicola TaxID=2029860 RepID=UPI003EBB4CAB
MLPRLRLAWILPVLAMIAPPALAQNPPDPIRYTLRFPAPESHYVEVEAIVPTGGAADLELYMAVWTPGSYLVREYARNVENMKAGSAEGKPLAVSKTRKNRWKFETGGAASIQVSYRVYCREMGVQTSWVDAGFALINGAGTFLTLVDRTPRPHEVTLVPPPGWLKSYTGLPDVPGNQPHRYVAADFDTLLDCPIYAGNPAVYEFAVDGKPHFLINEGEGGVWDGPRSARDVEAIVKSARSLWGSLPYDKYLFFNLLTETGGGLEHKNSTVLMSSRWNTRTRPAYLGWLDLVSHEFFHTWNVKRLRPAELGPFDYETEVTTKSLWLAEGVTSYYDRLLVRRAGLCSVEEYLEGNPGPGSDKARNDIEVLQDTPGRLVQPLESASFDAWIKYYRRDENTANTAVSYYTKGAVVGFLLDAEIRKATDGKKSLDDAMRLAFERYSGPTGYTPAQFRETTSEVAGADLSAFFARALESTDELDYAGALAWYGLRFKATEDEKGKGKKPPKAWLGLTTKDEGGRLTVSVVKRETPGYESGFNVGDEIVAIGEDRILPEVWSKRMEQYRPNEKVSVLVSRRGRLIRLDATFAAEPLSKFRLEPDPAATDEQKAHRKAWLGD